MRRCRKIPNAEILLRVLLIHLAEGCSLRETSVRARQGGIVDLSGVAILDRLKQAGEWFRWMNTKLMQLHRRRVHMWNLGYNESAATVRTGGEVHANA